MGLKIQGNHVKIKMPLYKYVSTGLEVLPSGDVS